MADEIIINNSCNNKAGFIIAVLLKSRSYCFLLVWFWSKYPLFTQIMARTSTVHSLMTEFTPLFAHNTKHGGVSCGGRGVILEQYSIGGCLCLFLTSPFQQRNNGLSPDFEDISVGRWIWRISVGLYGGCLPWKKDCVQLLDTPFKLRVMSVIPRVIWNNNKFN